MPPTGALTVSKHEAGEGATRDFRFPVTQTDHRITGVFGGMAFSERIATFTLRHEQKKTARALPE